MRTATILILGFSLVVASAAGAVHPGAAKQVFTTPLVSQANSPSWNPATKCNAVVMTMEQYVGSVPNPTQIMPYVGADYSGGALPLEGSKPAGTNPPSSAWPYTKRSIDPPCTVTLNNGMILPTLVEIHRVQVEGLSCDELGSLYPNVCDITFNVCNSLLASDCTHTAVYPDSMHKFHCEIDMNWTYYKIAPPTPTYHSIVDVQGFAFWDDAHLDSGYHSYSGWELHPLTAWRLSGTQQDFSVSASPSSISLAQGNAGTSTVTMRSLNGFSGTIALSAIISPSGPGVTVNPSSVSLATDGTASSALTVTTSGTTLPGSYVATITGSNGTLSRSATVSINVMPQADFSMALNPSSLTLSVGSSGSSTLTLQSLNGFAGSVSLSTYATPHGPAASLSSTTVSLTSGGSATSILNIKTNSTVGPGNYNVSVTGTNGTLSHNAILSVTLKLAPDFAIAPNPNSLTVTPGNSASSSITLTSLSGFNGQVSLSASVSVGGFGVQINPNNPTISSGGTSTSSLIITSPNNAIPGDYIVTLTGKSGSITRTIMIPLAVTSFVLAVDPGDVSFPAHQSGIFNVTIASLNGFNGSVTLAVQVSNNQLSASPSSTIVNVAAGGAAVTQLRVSSSSNGGYMITVSATLGKLLEKVSATVEVTNGPDFTIATNPIFIQLSRGSTDTVTVSATSVNGLSGTMNLKAEAHPGGPQVSVIPASLRMSPGGSSISTLTISLPTSTNLGLYSILVTGQSGPTHTVTIWLFVAQPQADFAISASPSTVSTSVNQAGTSTITVTALQGFNQIVSLSTNSASCNVATGEVTGAGSSTLSCNFAAVGTFHVIVTGSSGSLSHSTTVTFIVAGAKDFTLAASPSGVTISATGIGNSTITVSSLNGFTGTITLSWSGSQSLGLSCTLRPMSVTLGSANTSTLSCGGNAGQYNVTVSGTNGTVTHTTSVTYIVQDYSLTANPTSVSVSRGVAGNSTITMSALDGFTEAVNLGVSTNSTRLSCTLSSSNISGGSSSSTLQCSSGIAGDYYATVTGNSSGLTHSVSVTYHVTFAPDFSLSARPSSVAVNANTAGQSIITVTSQNGFSGVVSLSTNSTSCTLSPTSVTGSSLGTLSCTFSSTGTFNVGVKGTSGGLTHSVAVAYTVSAAPSFTISTNPKSWTAVAGANATFTIVVSGQNGFSGTVTLTAAVTPSNGLACTHSPTSVTLSGSTTNGNSTLSCSGSAGSYTVTMTGSSSGFTPQSATVSVTVQDFTIASGSASIGFNPGGMVNSTIEVTGFQGFSGVVNLSTSVSSQSITSSVNPTAVTGSGTALLTVSGSTTGSYSVTVIGRSDSLSHSVTISVVVGAQDFQISTNPTAISFSAGGTNMSIVSVTPISGFTGNVSLSAIVPSGLSSIFSNNPVTAGSTTKLTVSAASSLAAGTYTVVVTGTSGSFIHSANVTIKVLAKPAITFVADVPVVGSSSTAATTSSMTFTKGDLIVVYVSVGAGQTVNSIVDSGSPSSSYAETASAFNGNTILYLYTATAVTSSNNTITVTISAAGYVELSAAEYSGVVGFGALSTSTGTTTAPTISLTTQNSNGWVIVAYGWSGSGTHSGDTGFLDRHAGGVGTQHLDYGDTNSAKPIGTYTYSGTISQSDPWAMIALELV